MPRMKKPDETPPSEAPSENKRKRSPKPDFTAQVAAKYVEGGWSVITGNNDNYELIAKKDKRMHFVQIKHKEAESSRFQGESLNQFVQNAFSNGAEPVHAIISTVNKIVDGKKQPVSKIDFENVNANTRVLVGARKPKENVN